MGTVSVSLNERFKLSNGWFEEERKRARVELSTGRFRAGRFAVSIVSVAARWKGTGSLD